MKYEVRSFELDGINCWGCVPNSISDKEPLPLVIMPAEAEMTAMLPKILSAVELAIEEGCCNPFVLAGFESADWDEDFSPWEAPAISKKGKAFSGGAARTLDWLRHTFLPMIESTYPLLPGTENRSILGYSLGGLFSLWSFLESGMFGGCASCSGSLWYDGWMEYALERDVPANSRVYLSLGLAEEKARNSRMATVGDITRMYAELLKDDSNIRETTLVWHIGGHFQDVQERLTDALLWLIKG